MNHKVCHISTLYSSTDTRIFQKECVSLAKHGYEVHYIVANQKDDFIEGVKIHSVESSVSNRFQRMRNTSKKALEKALEIDAEIYHLHNPELLLISSALKKKGKKVIFDSHENFVLQILNKPYLPKFITPLISSIYKKYEDYILKKLDAVIVANPPDVKRILKINPNTIGVFNFPKLENDAITSWENKKNELVHVGTLTQVRGIKEMVQSLEHVNALLNIGGNWHSESYHDEVRALPSWKKVTEYGFVGREKRNELLSRSKIGVSTLMPIPNYKLAYSVKMFEYMAAGIPSIISDFPMWREVIEETNSGICVDPQNPKAIADAINYLLENESIAKQMGENGRVAIEKKYNWKTQEKLLIDLYHKILQ